MSKPFWEKADFQRRAKTLWNMFLFTRSQNLRDELLGIYMPITSMAARRTHNGLPASVDLRDLCADAALGLLGAIERWRPGRSPFIAYSFHRMRDAMMDGLRERDPVSRWARMLVRRLSEAKGLYHETHGCEPSILELARIAQLPYKVCARHIGFVVAEPFLSLEGITENRNGKEDGSQDCCWMGDPQSDSHVSDLEVEEFVEWMLIQIEKPRQRRICRMYLLDGISQREIAAGEGVHETRVCQVLDECRAIWFKRSEWLREEREVRDE